MKKIMTLVLVVSVILGMGACATKAENPGTAPVVTVTLPEGEEFAPNPDKANDTLALGINVNHPVPIKDWKISINLQRQGQGGGQAAQAAPANAAPEADGQQPRQRRAFLEVSGEKKPPKEWKWNYKGSPRREGEEGRMVTSLQTYRYEVTVTDIFDNVGTCEGTIPIGVIVVKDGDNYRMAVPAIIFPPNDSDLSKVSEDDQRANRRVLRLVARVLNKYANYAITVEGHANPTTAPGTPERTAEEAGKPGLIGLVPLSEARAKAVVDYLAASNDDGVSADRLKFVGIGGERTIADWDDAENNWTNRRVEFILHK